ncbi:MAG: hypothetical protein WBF58_08415 [Xanthobacteraceae bacterium]
MTAKRLILTAALLGGVSLGMTGASLAQGYYGGTYGQGYYDYAPGYGAYNYGPRSDCSRGGPGPRVGCGSGLGIGSQR